MIYAVWGYYVSFIRQVFFQYAAFIIGYFITEKGVIFIPEFAKQPNAAVIP